MLQIKESLSTFACLTFFFFTSSITLSTPKQDGLPDTNFGENNGKTTFCFENGTAKAHAMVIDNQKRILLAGSANSNFALAAFLGNSTTK